MKNKWLNFWYETPFRDYSYNIVFGQPIKRYRKFRTQRLYNVMIIIILLSMAIIELCF
jgi:hypothetical protein